MDFGMSGNFSRSVWAAALLSLLMVSLTAIGFAHRMPTVSDAAIEAYLLAGGSAADFCGGSDGEGNHTNVDCPACHIAGTAMLPGGLEKVIDAELVFVAKVVAPRASKALRNILDPAHGVRAPPLV